MNADGSLYPVHEEITEAVSVRDSAAVLTSGARVGSALGGSAKSGNLAQNSIDSSALRGGQRASQMLPLNASVSNFVGGADGVLAGESTVIQ